MARKSQELRLQQTIDLIAAYADAGIKNQAFRFLNDISLKMKRGRYPTKRQRDWLDKLIDEGVPVPEEQSDLYNLMGKARMVFLNDPDKSWEAGVLGDFMYRESKGWDMSGKQLALMKKLLEKSEKLASGELKLDVTDEMEKDLRNACLLWRSYTTQWQIERPALSKAKQRVEKFLNGEGYIEEYHYDKLINGVGAKLRKFKKPRFTSGDMGYTGGGKYAGGQHPKLIWMCVSDAYISENGAIVNDWIDPDGRMVTKDQDRISKR